jgi:hypothetical protein
MNTKPNSRYPVYLVRRRRVKPGGKPGREAIAKRAALRLKSAAN